MFNSLDIKARKKVFELYISKCGGTAKEADLDTWSRHDFNGREVSTIQIRNAIRIASQRAELKGEPLSRNHINTIIEVYRNRSTSDSIKQMFI